MTAAVSDRIAECMGMSPIMQEAGAVHAHAAHACAVLRSVWSTWSDLDRVRKDCCGKLEVP